MSTLATKKSQPRGMKAKSPRSKKTKKRIVPEVPRYGIGPGIAPVIPR